MGFLVQAMENIPPLPTALIELLPIHHLPTADMDVGQSSHLSSYHDQSAVSLIF